ncbi:hypothetical protein BYT27DRAFT_7264846 [Phlegmacium glaucopus]|nr:hypothetical protein BYT27DRAFT_7264846 [Phlegmacium glaucopus]
MSDDDPDTPLDFPSSDTEHYPESARNKKSPYIWEPEILQIMKEAGFGPEDMENSPDEESQSKQEDCDEEGEVFEATNQPAQAQPAGKFKIKLLAPKPPSKAGTASQQVVPTKPSKSPSHQGHWNMLADSKTLPVLTGAPVKAKKHQLKADTENSDTHKEEMCIKKKKHPKKKARLDNTDSESEPQGEGATVTATNNIEQPPSTKKHGRPRKTVEEKVSKPVAGSAFNASVFVSVENPPQLMHGKTHKTDKHVAQEPRVEGPFTLIRSMKWADFLDEIAGWVGVDKENLRINGLSWGFQKQKAHLPLTNEQAFKMLREQVKAKNSSATVIFIYHLICKHPKNQDAADPTIVNNTEEETRWGKKLSLDDKLAPIIVQLETLYAVGHCSEHPRIHCFYTSICPNKSWHFELNKARLAVWANAINRKEVNYECAPIGCNFFGAKDRIQSKNSNTVVQVVPQTPPPPHLGGNSFAPPPPHAYAWPPFYSGPQQGAHLSPNPMSPSPIPFHYPPSLSPYYPFSTPFGYGSLSSWGYPTTPQTPGPKIIPPAANTPQVLPLPGLPEIPAPADPTSFPATPDLKAWCMEHMLGKVEYEGLLRLGFRVGDGHELANLERATWEWAGIAPLARMRILAACQATVPSD